MPAIPPTLARGALGGIFRVTMPDVTIVTAVLMSEFTREFPYDDVATWSISMSATDSTIGMVVTDTPVVPDPTGP